MSDADQTRAYRKRIYDKYVSEKVRADGVNYSEKDYQRWAEAAKVRLRGWLPSDRNTPVLDMGCGPGNFLYLLDQLGYTDLTGVDLSPEQIALAKQWCPKATIILGDVREVLAEHSEYYGLITGFDIIEHFSKDEILSFLELVSGALRPGARLIIQTPNAESPWMGAVAYGDLSHEWFFTPSGLEHTLRLAGFAGFEARESGPYIHGIKSFFRVVLWSGLKLLLGLWNLAETGSRGSGIFTRVFVCTAIKQ